MDRGSDIDPSINCPLEQGQRLRVQIRTQLVLMLWKLAAGSASHIPARCGNCNCTAPGRLAEQSVASAVEDVWAVHRQAPLGFIKRPRLPATLRVSRTALIKDYGTARAEAAVSCPEGVEGSVSYTPPRLPQNLPRRM